MENKNTFNARGDFNRFPTHRMEIQNKHGFRFNDWGTFASDVEALRSAASRGLARGLFVVGVYSSNGQTIYS